MAAMTKRPRVVRTSTRSARRAACLALRLEALEPRLVFSVGQLATSFNGTGLAEFHLGPATSSTTGFREAAQPDGKLVVAGSCDGIASAFVARLNPDGTFDSTFGTNGQVTLTIPNANLVVNGLLVEPSGQITMAGWSDTNARAAAVLLRLNANGSRDTAFGVNGLDQMTSLALQVSDIAEQSDGKYVLTGIGGGANALGAIRLTHAGTIDTTFGSNGASASDFNALYPTFQFGVPDSDTENITVQTDQKILVVGTSGYDPPTGPVALWTIVRYNSNGSLDTTFGTGGVVETEFASTVQTAIAVQVVEQPDGRLLVGGSAGPFEQAGFALARYNANGTLDGTFNGGAPIVASVPGETGSEGGEIALLPNGKVLIAGTGSTSSTTNFAVLRYNSDGSADTTFGNNGAAVSPFNSTTNSNGLDPEGGSWNRLADHVGLAVTPNGTIFVMSSGSIVHNVFSNAVIAAFVGQTSWNNTAMKQDVNNNGAVTPVDALLVLTFLNINGSGSLSNDTGGPPPYVDVNNDGSVTPVDALQVLDFLNTPVVTTQVVRSLLPAQTPVASAVDLWAAEFGLAAESFSAPRDDHSLKTAVR